MPEQVQWPAEQILKKVDTIYTVLLGEPGTCASGLCGDVKAIKKHIEEQNGKVASHDREIARLKLMAYIALLLMGTGGVGVGVTQLFGA